MGNRERWDLADLRDCGRTHPSRDRAYERGLIDGYLIALEEQLERDHARLMRAIDRRARALTRWRMLGWLALAATGAWVWWGGKW
jgi:hypothetical protein